MTRPATASRVLLVDDREENLVALAATLRDCGAELDTARSGIEVLVEVVAALRLRGYFPDPKFEIYVDGGVRRASDVLKAIALGATAVGVGRPFLYAFCAYGQEGVEKAIQIFRVSTHRVVLGTGTGR